MQIVDSPQIVLGFLTGVIATIITGSVTGLGRKVTAKAAEFKESAPKYILIGTIFLLVVVLVRSKTSLEFTDSLLIVSFLLIIPAIFIYNKRREKQ